MSFGVPAQERDISTGTLNNYKEHAYGILFKLRCGIE